MILSVTPTKCICYHNKKATITEILIIFTVHASVFCFAHAFFKSMMILMKNDVVLKNFLLFKYSFRSKYDMSKMLL